MTALLAGVKIVDLSRILAGPFATQLLADLGADVVKVEPPEGDATRAWGPPFAADGESSYFRSANRGKRGLVLDLKTGDGRKRLDALLADADALVENFLPRSAAALGVDFATLHARFPKLVVASIRAFASDTAAKDRAGYDFLMQAESGWMSITGPVEGPPSKVGVALVDVLAGLYTANAVTAALLERARGGPGARGRHLEIPLFETALAGLVNVGAATLTTGEDARRYGNAHPSIVPYQSFATRDGTVAIAVGNDRQFAALMAALGLAAALAANPGWRTNPGRVADRDRVTAELARAIAPRTRDDVLARLDAAGVPAGPVRSVREALLACEGTLHRALAQFAGAGPDARTIGTPIRVDGTRAVSTLPPPRREQ